MRTHPPSSPPPAPAPPTPAPPSPPGPGGPSGPGRNFNDAWRFPLVLLAIVSVGAAVANFLFANGAW